MEYSITIPNESEKFLESFDKIVQRFGLHPKYFDTKDGFIYEFTFSNLKTFEIFKETVSRELPNLFPVNDD